MDDDTAHVMPMNDLIHHDPTDDCPCGPRSQIVQRPGLSDRWLYVHYSLDGREMGE